MKITDAPCKIKAVHLGEASINMIRMDQVPLKAKYALLSEDGNVCGYVEKSTGWSDRVLEKMKELGDIMEEEALGLIFSIQVDEENQAPKEESEPSQF
jgi:hypothetical protein